METRPYAPYDLFWLDTHTPAGWFSTATLRQLVDPSLSVSFYHHHTYLGSSGLFKLWEGVYEAWLVLLVPPPSPWEFMTHLRESISLGIRLTEAHRLQAYCLSDYTPGLVLATRMGFAREGVLRAATPDKRDITILGKVL